MENEKIKAQQWRERERGEKKHSCIWKWKKVFFFHDTHTNIHTQKRCEQWL